MNLLVRTFSWNILDVSSFTIVGSMLLGQHTIKYVYDTVRLKSMKVNAIKLRTPFLIHEFRWVNIQDFLQVFQGSGIGSSPKTHRSNWVFNAIEISSSARQHLLWHGRAWCDCTISFHLATQYWKVVSDCKTDKVEGVDDNFVNVSVARRNLGTYADPRELNRLTRF